jgi:phospholipid/cholesterol/gamma-HCH transport system ATP-binding protein
MSEMSETRETSEPATVALRGVDLGYGEQPVLRDVELRIAEGEIVSIIGGSGSGKSTILRAMTGLLPPLQGTVELFGEDLYAREPRERAPLLSRTGLLFQRDALFGSMSVLQNVMFPVDKLAHLPRPVTRELAYIKLETLGVAELALRRPGEVSGGQAKRVALARATVLDPALLLCDEPTAGLDPVNAGRLGRLLLRLRDVRGASVVIVTHDMQTVRQISDRTLVVAGGGIAASGTPGELQDSADEEIRAFFRHEERE